MTSPTTMRMVYGVNILCRRVFTPSSQQWTLHSVKLRFISPEATSSLIKLSEHRQRRPIKKAEKISRAMLAYIERAKAHDAQMKEEIAQYEIGKRHLANIMGKNAETFTQEDIDKAIEYLLPSGLYAKKARPLMKHPYEIFPPQKSAQFGMDGRPFHWLFYTAKPNYYNLMYDIVWKIEALKKKEDESYAQTTLFTKPKEINLKSSEWIDLDRLKQIVLEKITEEDHNNFINLMERLVSQQFSATEEEFILKYRKKYENQLSQIQIETPLIDEDGRQYVKTVGKRKSCLTSLTLWIQGSGKFTINGQDLLYFRSKSSRAQLMYPLQFVKKIGEVDVEATVEGGGHTSQAGSIRFALSKALASFMDSATVEKMRLAGLLMRDLRRKERKKPGQPKARKKSTWKKR
ncbi:ribosomal S9, mitochondrial [Octopus vulgaris]|uniref:Small ribosomal subunit protein uS9m n=1 Tax=Octopus vulgaris TaxID=6645 RepID=A0AA36B336_OCTVU|nr:ribosomal S9, mitochondrial [Octopus vulgaris]